MIESVIPAQGGEFDGFAIFADLFMNQLGFIKNCDGFSQDSVICKRV